MFIDRRPNAVVLAATMYVALAIVTIAAIYASSNQLAQGLIGVAVYGIVGVALQGVALVILEIAVPGRFREHIDAPALHPAVFATAVMLLAVAGVIAAALS
ncbi:integral membrane protein [Mycobacterium tuberculosis]|nr:integral membrane protein [Mycobacterium tuberculosis]CKT78343.1 integral membrane protein [Mycobacterium tuberculosis]